MVVNFGRITLGEQPVIIGIVNQFLDMVFLRELSPLVKILEIRADSLLAIDSLPRLQKYCQEINSLNKFSLLLTVRENSQLDFTHKQQIINTLLPDCDGLDLEIDSQTSWPLFAQAKRAHKTILASYHNFQETPDRSTLLATIDQAERLGADITKLAVMANSKQDVDLLYNILQLKQNLIAISMGKFGSQSRVEALRYGSLATYAPLSVSNAPGQLTVEQIVSFLSK